MDAPRQFAGLDDSRYHHDAVAAAQCFFVGLQRQALGWAAVRGAASNAIAATPRPPWMREVPVPEGAPKTKPRKQAAKKAKAFW